MAGRAMAEANFEARAQRAAGRAAIGIIGAGVPEALVLAVGAAPLAIRPDDRATPHADAFVPGESARLKALAEPALDGRLAWLDLLIVTRAHEWLYYTLKEAARTGAGRVPPLHLLDFVPSTESAVRRYNLRGLERLAAVLERMTGVALTPDNLAAGLAQVERRDDRLRAIQALRDEGRVAGSAALALIAQARTLDIDPFAAEADRAIASWRKAPARSGPRLLLLPSPASDIAAIHALVEAAGATVVTEDSALGSRSARARAPEGPSIAALLDHELEGFSGPERQPRGQRTAWAERQMMRPDIDGVLFAIPADDHRFGWDYPLLRDRAAALGKARLALRGDPRESHGVARGAITDFVSGIAKARAA